MPESGQPLSMTVGVTGHRNLPGEAVAPLEAAVRAALVRLRAHCPHTPVELVSSLADGADRLCARVALEMGCRLTVPLPMAAADYRADFDEASCREFDHLLGQAQRVFIAPHTEAPPDPLTRPFGYRQAGRYIAGHCHVLIALWDGEAVVTPGGGTYETLAFLRGETAIGDAPVWQVVTPRMGREPPADCFTLRELYADAGAEAAFWDALARTDRFNADCETHHAAIAAADAGAILADDAMAARLPPALCALRNLYAQADTLSLIYRDKRLAAIRLLSFAGLLLVLLFLGYDNMELGPALPLYGVLMVGAALYNRVVGDRRYHEKHLTYRLLAEVLRVQFFWSLAGIGERASEQFPNEQREDARWVAFALRHIDTGAGEETEDFTAHIGACWLQGQADYHTGNVRRKTAQLRFNGRVTGGFLYAAVAILALMLAITFLRPAWMELVLFTAEDLPIRLMHPGTDFTLRALLKVALGLASAATAFLANYYGKLSLGSQVKNSGRMARMYAEAARRADTAPIKGDRAALTRLYRELGREEVAEIGSWMLYSLEQAPELIF